MLCPSRLVMLFVSPAPATVSVVIPGVAAMETLVSGAVVGAMAAIAPVRVPLKVAPHGY